MQVARLHRKCINNRIIFLRVCFITNDEVHTDTLEMIDEGLTQKRAGTPILVEKVEVV